MGYLDHARGSAACAGLGRIQRKTAVHVREDVSHPLASPPYSKFVPGGGDVQLYPGRCVCHASSSGGVRRSAQGDHVRPTADAFRAILDYVGLAMESGL